MGSWWFCIQHLPCSVSFSACLEVVWRFKRRTFCIGSLRVQLILACPRGATLFGPQWTKIGGSSFKFNTSSEHAPEMEKKLWILDVKHPMGNNQTKSPIKMKDNSIANMFGEVNLCISTMAPSKKWVFHIMVCVGLKWNRCKALCGERSLAVY